MACRRADTEDVPPGFIFDANRAVQWSKLAYTPIGTVLAAQIVRDITPHDRKRPREPPSNHGVVDLTDADLDALITAAVPWTGRVPQSLRDAVTHHHRVAVPNSAVAMYVRAIATATCGHTEEAYRLWCDHAITGSRLSLLRSPAPLDIQSLMGSPPFHAYIFMDNIQRQMVVSNRGTVNTRDVLRDVDEQDVKVQWHPDSMMAAWGQASGIHETVDQYSVVRRGFWKQAEGLVSRLDVIHAMAVANRASSLLFTGHSLGAAVAAMLYLAHVTRAPSPPGGGAVVVPPIRVLMYGVATPRCCDAVTAQLLSLHGDSRTMAFCDDMVARITPRMVYKLLQGRYRQSSDIIRCDTSTVCRVLSVRFCAMWARWDRTYDGRLRDGYVSPGRVYVLGGWSDHVDPQCDGVPVMMPLRYADGTHATFLESVPDSALIRLAQDTGHGNAGSAMYAALMNTYNGAHGVENYGVYIRKLTPSRARTLTLLPL
jgi:hypothetical protein